MIHLLKRWLQRTEPDPVDALVNETIPQILASFVLCYIIDAWILRLGLHKSRWFSLHTVINLAIVLVSAEDTLATLADPVHAVGGPVSTLAISLVIALHVYHAVFFNLTAVDVVHHIVSVGILGPLAVWFRPGAFVNYCCFFTSGLPGGVDYFMLALVKEGKMSSLREKYLNMMINVWCRGPFLVIGAFVSYQSALESSSPQQCAASWAGGASGSSKRMAALVTALVLFWNGQWFAQRVIVNYGARSRESTAEMYAGSIMPRNLSKGSLSKLARNLSRESLLRLAEAN